MATAPWARSASVVEIHLAETPDHCRSRPQPTTLPASLTAGRPPGHPSTAPPGPNRPGFGPTPAPKPPPDARPLPLPAPTGPGSGPPLRPNRRRQPVHCPSRAQPARVRAHHCAQTAAGHPSTAPGPNRPGFGPTPAPKPSPDARPLPLPRPWSQPDNTSGRPHSPKRARTPGPGPARRQRTKSRIPIDRNWDHLDQAW
jgi:hypothetical protein